MKESQSGVGFAKSIREGTIINHGENQQGKKVHRSHKSKTGHTRSLASGTKVRNIKTHWLVDCRVLQ